MKLYFELDEVVKSIELPMITSEIVFGDFCDFRTFESQYFDAVKDNNQELAVSCFTKAIGALVKGDVVDLPLAFGADDFDDIVNNERIIGIGEELSLNKLYGHLHVVINTYHPEEIPTFFRFQHDNKTFVISKSDSARVLANSPLTTGEALETMEIQRRSVAAEGRKLATGNIDFTLGLTELALLVRQQGEKLPSGTKRLEQFVEKRRLLFSNVTLDIILDLRFFLLDALLRSKKTQNSNFSGMAHPRRRRRKRRVNTRPNKDHRQRGK